MSIQNIIWYPTILFASPPLPHGVKLNKFSVIFSSDGETFISADDLRINLWNLEISNQSFNIVDVKPANMEDLTGKLLDTPVFMCIEILLLLENSSWI